MALVQQLLLLGSTFLKLNTGQGLMICLIVGLGTEAVIFFLSAFEPKHAEVDWSKVYPELSEDYEAPAVHTATRISNRPGAGESPLLKIDEM